MIANYSCILLDVDGTLLDFHAAEREALTEVLQKAGLPHGEQEVALFSSINAELWAALERGEIKKDKLMVRRFTEWMDRMGCQGDAIRLNNVYMTTLSTQAPTFPGACELLEELAEFATLAVVSNGSTRVLMERLRKSGLLPYFDDVFISERMGAHKPSPRVFDIALRRLGVKNRERVLMVGDSLAADIKGAHNAHLAACWCNFTHAENHTAIQPEYTVHDYAELRQVALGEEAIRYAETREKRHFV